MNQSNREPLDYQLTEQRKEGKTTYGLQAVSTRDGLVVFDQKDIITNPCALRRLMERLAQSDVHPVHLPDIVEDFLEEHFSL